MMRSYARLACICIAIFVQPLFAQETDSGRAVTNEEFVRHNLKAFFSELLDSSSISHGAKVQLDLRRPPSDNLDVSGSALTAAMKDASVVMLQDASEKDEKLEIDIDDLSLRYANRGGGLFSRGDVHRILHVSASFRTSNNGLGGTQDFMIRDYEGPIYLPEIDSIEDRSSPFFFAQLPPGPVQRLWEPVIVTSVIGGLVYLFFASR